MPSLDPVMLSALEHYSYCPRQCALIHLEQVWSENIYTMRGRDVHKRVDEISSQDIGSVRYERALPIWSRRLGLTGKADLVEFHDDIPYPVEYKSGSTRKGAHETLQLCAQAICLEEMFLQPVHEGALYWHSSRERKIITLTDTMKDNVVALTHAVREMLSQRLLPSPVNDKRCQHCSLYESCLPTLIAEKNRIKKMSHTLFEVES